MDWKKITTEHYHKDPVPHIYCCNIFDTKEYDKLYENQNNLSHQMWEEFDKKYKIGFEFKEDFDQIDYNKEVMCLWFYKERSNGTIAYVSVEGQEYVYQGNCFLITKSKNIKLREKKKKYIRNPFMQIDMPGKTWDNILKRLDKIS